MRGETSAFQRPLARQPKSGRTHVQQPEQPEPSGSVERISTDERTRAICDGSIRKRQCGLLANRRVEAGSENRRLGQGRVKPHRAGWAVSQRGFGGALQAPHTLKPAMETYHAKQSTASAAVWVLSLVRPPRRFCAAWRARRMRNRRVQPRRQFLGRERLGSMVVGAAAVPSRFFIELGHRLKRAHVHAFAAHCAVRRQGVRTRPHPINRQRVSCA